MSKIGMLVSVAENQAGKNPQIVTPDFPFPVKLEDDLLSSDVIGERAIKVSTNPSLYAATLNGLMYTLTGSYSIADATYLAMNVTFAAESVIHKVTANASLPLFTLLMRQALLME